MRKWRENTLIDPSRHSLFHKGVSGLSPVFPIVAPLIPRVNSVNQFNIVNQVNSINHFNSLNHVISVNSVNSVNGVNSVKSANSYNIYSGLAIKQKGLGCFLFLVVLSHVISLRVFPNEVFLTHRARKGTFVMCS